MRTCPRLLVTCLVPTFFVGCNVDGEGTTPPSVRFESPSTLRVGCDDPYAAAASMVAADFDDDGDLDLAVCHLPSNRDDSIEPNSGISLLFNDGNGVFEAGTCIGVGIMDGPIAAEDIDSDGDVDLILASDNVVIMLNEGDGTFESELRLFGSNVYPYHTSVAVGDLDGDGDPDLVVATDEEDTISLIFNEGALSFSRPLTMAVGPGLLGGYPAEGPHSVSLADFDGNSTLDIVTANWSSATVSVFLNDGNGSFAAPDQVSAANAYALTQGDFDGDGDLDIATTGYPKGSVLLNRGDGAFVMEGDLGFEILDEDIATGDFNGDGLPDLVVAHLELNEVRVLVSEGNAGFVVGAVLEAELSYATPLSFATGDFDQDGNVDLVVMNWEPGIVSVFLNATD